MSFNAHGFSLDEQRYAPFARMSRHRHPEAYICLVLAGGFLDCTAKDAAAVETGAVLVRPAGDEHRTSCGVEGAVCLKIQPKADWLSPRDTDALFRERSTLRSADYLLRIRKIHELFSTSHLAEHAHSLGVRLQLQSDIIDLMARIVRPQVRIDSANENWLERVRMAIIQSPLRPWTVTSIAELAGRHPVHVSRAFRERYGETVSRFFRRRRLERCRELIMDGRIELAEISSLAGFSDQSHFTREYKRAFGDTPGRERERLRVLHDTTENRIEAGW